LNAYFLQGNAATALKGGGSFNTFMNFAVKEIMKLVHFRQIYRDSKTVLPF